MSIEIELDPDFIAGQMVIAGFAGKVLPAQVAEALGAGRLGGVILFERNLGSPLEVRGLTDAIREASAVPSMIAIDHEGGSVQRLRAPFTVWPRAREVGVTAKAAKARALGKAMAAELLAVGINVNFAPVLDVDTNPANPVIGDRSFSQDATRVAKLGAAMIEGFNQAGLLSCGKHFPGHGDTDLDSHHDLPVVNADRETLDRRELLPFQAAIKAGVPMIMTAHLKATAIDKYYPATISRPILYDLLRVTMGFNGLIVSDDLEMGALADNMPIEDAAFSAARAGCDVLIACSGPDRAEVVRDALANAITTGALDFAAATFTARRILDLKDKRLRAPLPGRDEIEAIVGAPAHQELAASLSGPKAWFEPEGGHSLGRPSVWWMNLSQSLFRTQSIRSNSLKMFLKMGLICSNSSGDSSTLPP